MDLFEKFINVITAFEDNNVEYKLIGDFAVVLHGFPRLTQDIDIFIRPEKNNIDNLKTALKQVFDDPAIEEITPEELNRYPVIRYGTPDGFNIDLIAKIGEVFSFDDVICEKRIIDGQSIKIATTESLIKLKENTMRDVDSIDLQFLRKKQKNKNDG